MPYRYTTAEMIRATYEVLERNNLQDAYIRPVVYGPANMSFNPNTESFTVIETWEMAPFLGEKLLRVMTSSFQRPNPKGFKIEAKAAGHYVNSIMASQEAKGKGFDEALLTDMNGYIAEGPGANMFFEQDGKLYTPAAGNILPGITRATVLELCAELDIPVEQGQYTPQQLKTRRRRLLLRHRGRSHRLGVYRRHTPSRYPGKNRRAGRSNWPTKTW